MKTLRLVLFAGFFASGSGFAQAPPPAATPPPPPVVSPEITSDHKIIFRLRAPEAKSVKLSAGDIPKASLDVAVFSKDDQGIWSATTGVVDAGAYRYRFNIDGVQTVDPSNPMHSESNANMWSQVNIAGSDFMDTRDVPHGAVAEIPYYSSVLQKNRRMHVYTPPGYGTSTAKYPVFYLLHGASDSDDGWPSVGRAGIILDNLIADKKAKPMIIVMPAGHTSQTPVQGSQDKFAEEFAKDIMPNVEKNYRVMTDRANTAIAGLSMGGRQTLDIAMSHLDRFAYIGVFSSGAFFGRVAPGATQSFEDKYASTMDNASLKKGLKLVWLSTGVDDRLMPNTKSTVEMLKKHGFDPVFKESPGGHTWINWRNYLNEFAPQLFVKKQS